ncbi:MAG: NAD(P)-dependent oxidoreductase [Marinovum sp.]|nr:NAD(P)-dependent oxidoreductase [Marinovum sp.]
MGQKIAVIGLGSMGYGIAQSCLRAGHKVFGADVRAEAVERFQSEGGQSGALADHLGNIDTAVLVVLNAQQTEAVLFGEDGIAPKMKAGALVVGCATVPPACATHLAQRCGELGLHYLDAPISGGSIKAAAGQLGIMASGTPGAFDAAEPMLTACAETVFRLGDSAGMGSAMKAVNQLLAGVHIATMAEAMNFGLSQGIAPGTFLEVISKCAGSSWMLENRAPHIVAGDYTPHSQVNIWPKDLGIVGEIAQASGVETPIAETALAQYRRAVDMGLGHEDDAAVIKVYAKAAGLVLPGEDA